MFYDWRDTQALGRYAWHYGADVHLAHTPWSDPVLVDLSAVVQPGHALPPTLAQHPAFSLYATLAAPVAQTVHPVYVVAPIATDTPLPGDARVHDLVVDVTATHIGSVVPVPDWALVPARLGLAGFIGDGQFADCTLRARDAPYALHVSRVFLARASNYFRQLFSTSQEREIALPDWSAPVVALAVIHMYAAARVTYWLELKQLALAANRQCAAVLEAEFRDVEMEEEPK
ncbi:hypothetical protein GGF32_008137 [Allomyces javanicus]|nr:hypothetical protein GGF32_008137 [Allomyces javanicus]